MPQEHPPEYWKRYYFFGDERGNYQAQPLTGLGRIYDDRSEPWRDIDPAEEGRHWEVPMKVLRAAYPLRGDLDRLAAARKLDLLDEAGLIHWTRGGAPRYKIYADMTKGERLSDVVTTVGRIESKDRGIHRMARPGPGGAAGHHHQGVHQPRRHCSRPLLRLRNDLCGCRDAGSPVDRH